ncbi:DUF6415 family natural product biosynthesis protein [Streptomyces yunnanensis]|uniref:Uncharacterized protein n=1 Tax=Streptomyces yunnanensis TaxID=156453 RepID=A0A9X8MTI0_9ACTN|nr:DUF6415 family natural product biosynthesis protein [Streptomyces yunnanensis]SHL76385.1 hypothetical protein SAMN05216268_106113 [Streptomyces yunnanensis]
MTDRLPVRGAEAPLAIHESRATPTVPIDVETMRRTIDRALALRSTPLELEELEDLTLLLRGHINLLLPSAQAATDKLWPGSIEWCCGMGRLSTVRFHCEQTIEASMLTAPVQVSRLAHDCQWLLEGHLARQK